jgi:tetratricopeptide (TPR) repeat protein
MLVASAARATDVPPPPDLSQVEPQVKALIEQAHEKLVAAPESAEAWGYYASVLVVHEFLSEAITAFETASRFDPGDFRWPYHIAARLSADEPLPQAGLGKCLLDTGELDEARRHLYRAIRLNPRCRPALSATADYWRRAGDLEKADEYAARAAAVADTAAPDPVLTAVELMGVSTTAVLNRADALVYAGRDAEARWEIVKLIKDNPRSAQGRRALGKLYLDDGDYEQAVEHLRAALAASPGFMIARLDLAFALTRLNRFDEARQEYDTAIAANSTSADAHRGLAVCLAAQGEVQAAVESFRRAVELAPEDRQARVGYGKALYCAGDDRAALEILLPEAKAAGEKVDKIAIEAIGFAGLALGRQGRHREAVGLLERASNAAPTQANLRLGWAGTLVGLGRDREAVEVLQGGLDLNPRAGRIAVQLILLLSTSPEDEVRDGRRGVRLGEQWARSTQWRRAVILDALACAYAEAGRIDDAVRTAQRALALANEHDQPELASTISQHLEQFSQGRPWRRPPSPEP